MQFSKYRIYILNFFLISSVLVLTGCHNTILHPNSSISLEQRYLILISFFIMLCIIIPVFIMTFLFPIKYREDNVNSSYKPNWSHSNLIELLVWGFPVIIIIFLSVLSWKSTHNLDPSKPIVSKVQPIKISVISLDWKWLFIYPNEKIATINELVFPINTPIIFELTSNSVMNSFFIPSLGSQIYTMAGMNTKLNLMANKFGTYKGISSNYSGRGFSDMKFKVIVTSNLFSFNKWLKKVRSSSNQLNSISNFEKIAVPSEKNAIQYFSNVNKNLFNMVIKKIQNKNNNFLLKLNTV
ncbi:MAG: ubiquinol oxidase subunit II [Buchnera aphidicola (Floraphis choui)]